MCKKLTLLILIVSIGIMARASIPTVAFAEGPATCPPIKLIQPEYNFNPGGPDYPPAFFWRWDGQLKDNEYFDLRMWPEGLDNHWLGVMDYRATPRQSNVNGEYAVTANISKDGDHDRFPGFYLWSVAIISPQPDGTVREVCPEAGPHRFIYAPQVEPPDDHSELAPT